MTILKSMEELLIGSIIIVIVFLTVGGLIETVNEYCERRKENINNDRKKTVVEEITVEEYEDGHYEGDMN